MRRFILCCFLVASWLSAFAAPPAPGEKTVVQVRRYNGRPVVFVNGKPLPMPTYSPICFSTPHYLKQVPWFAPHKMGVLFMGGPSAAREGWGTSLFWHADTISSTPITGMEVDKGRPSFDEQLAVLDKADPDAWIFIRDLQCDPSALLEEAAPGADVHQRRGQGERQRSLASDLYWDCLARVAAAQIAYVERSRGATV